MESCIDKLNHFNECITSLVNAHLPLKTVIRCNTDKPWLTDHFRELIKRRQKALKSGQTNLYNNLRNSINRKAKRLKRKFYSEQIELAKDSRNFFKGIKSLTGTSKPDSLTGLANTLHEGNITELCKSINEFFASISSEYPRIVVQHDHHDNPAPNKYIISVEEVRNALIDLKPHKSPGPDDLPTWVLRDFAQILAPPIASILNASVRQRLVPTIWKRAYISPIPKVNPPRNIEKDLRPISLTAILSKTMESFIYSWLLASVIQLIHCDQFGGIKGSSTIFALIETLHYIINHSNDSNEYVRVILLDFQKAFDKISHPVLITKLHLMGVPAILIEWITSFLEAREQCVKIGHHRSDFTRVNGGVPQGTRLGPLLFIIFINDLRPTGKCIKFIDDTTLFSFNSINNVEKDPMQSRVNEVLAWCNNNMMTLNATKTKDLVFHFGDSPPLHLRPLRVNNEPIETVQTAKLLGITLSSNLKWNDHIDTVIKKANTKLYLIIQLKRSGFRKDHLHRAYLSLVRPLLEYAVAVWHPGLPLDLSSDLERIQKRALLPHNYLTTNA